MTNKQTFAEWVESILCWDCGNYEEMEKAKYNTQYFCHGTGDYMRDLRTKNQGCPLFKEKKEDG